MRVRRGQVVRKSFKGRAFKLGQACRPVNDVKLKIGCTSWRSSSRGRLAVYNHSLSSTCAGVFIRSLRTHPSASMIRMLWGVQIIEVVVQCPLEQAAKRFNPGYPAAAAWDLRVTHNIRNIDELQAGLAG